MPSSTIVRADEVNTHFNEWLGAAEGGVFLMRQEQTSGAVLRFDSAEQASEVLEEDVDARRYLGPFTGDECRSEVSRFIAPQVGQIRFTTWLDSAAEMAPPWVCRLRRTLEKVWRSHYQGPRGRLHRLGRIRQVRHHL